MWTHSRWWWWWWRVTSHSNILWNTTLWPFPPNHENLFPEFSCLLYMRPWGLVLVQVRSTLVAQQLICCLLEIYKKKYIYMCSLCLKATLGSFCTLRQQLQIHFNGAQTCNRKMLCLSLPQRPLWTWELYYVTAVACWNIMTLYGKCLTSATRATSYKRQVARPSSVWTSWQSHQGNWRGHCQGTKRRGKDKVTELLGYDQKQVNQFE